MTGAARILLGSLFLVGAMSLFSCFPTLKKEAQCPEESLVPVRFSYPTFRDDTHVDSLVLALERSLLYLNRLDSGKIFRYGPHKFACQYVRESHKAFLKLIRENSDPDELSKKVKEHFRVYRAAGRAGNNKVLFTGYFEPVLDGLLTSDKTFKYPIYQTPDDLLRIDLSRFNKKFEGEKIIARIERKNVLPYYSRYQIENEKVLAGRNLEIAWLKNPIDVAFLQIQGSGRLKLPDGKTIMVGYQVSNGQPYRSIGRYMIDRGFIDKEQISMQTIRSYLFEHPEVIEEVLDHNPSYVFFRILESGPYGSINVPLTPGRSLALDTRLFPKGALAFVTCQRPVLDSRGKIVEWTKLSRFVVNQDTGGAIKGAGRGDLFWGSGLYAEVAAGHLKHDGELYILIKKD